MKMHLLRMHTWLVMVASLHVGACVRSVDDTKIRCSTSEHCPTGFVCASGRCVSRSMANGGAAGGSGAGGGGTVDSSAADAKTSGSDVLAQYQEDARDVSADWPASVPADASLSDSAGTAAGGSVATGGAVASGGAVGTGGVATSGGAVGTGGTISTGGITGSGGASTCQRKPRDCTSPLDNDCNGTPDSQETTYCTCPVGQTRACQEHAGYDKTGICKAGSQSCAASSDKTTSGWSDCTGAVGPAAEVCDAAGLDENCNGQANEGCECIEGTSVPCDCGPATTCTSGKKGTCSVTKQTWYRDADGDGYGSAAQPSTVCPGTAGYVSNADDCDDASASFKPGISVCTTSATQRNWCESGGGGVTKTEPCGQGCINGTCRSDGTVGLPGYVSCTTTHTPRCSVGDGCSLEDGSCGASAAAFSLYCDGPNDCPSGQKCWFYSIRGGALSKCASAKPENYYYEVCDPLANSCTCTLFSADMPIYTCPS